MVTATLAATALLLIATGTIALRQRNGIGMLVGLLCVSIAYDAATIALGTSIGAGSTLHALNTGRYWLHALLTPLAIIAAAAIAARLGVRSLASLGGRILTGTLTAALIAVGVVTEAARLDLEPVTTGGTLRYTNAAAAGPPVAAILTIVALIVIGAMIWRRSRTPWLCLGAIAMFASAAVAMGDRFWIGNVGELVLQAGIVATLLTGRVADPLPTTDPRSARFHPNGGPGEPSTPRLG